MLVLFLLVLITDFICAIKLEIVAPAAALFAESVNLAQPDIAIKKGVVAMLFILAINR